MDTSAKIARVEAQGLLMEKEMGREMQVTTVQRFVGQLAAWSFAIAFLASLNSVSVGQDERSLFDEASQPLVSTIEPADWPMYNQGVEGWRLNAAEQKLTAENAKSIELKWQFPAKDSEHQLGVVHVTPTVVRGHVYFGTATYPAFYKLRPDGTLAWRYSLGSGEASAEIREGGTNTIDADNGIISSALVTDAAVYFGNSAGVFYALDRMTGAELWKVDTRAEGFPNHHPINVFMSSPILADGKIVVGGGGYEHPYPLDPSYECCTGRGFVVAFEPMTGEVVWKYEVGEEPEEFLEPIAIEDAYGKHVFSHGPSTSSVWSTPSYDQSAQTIYFGTDVHNSPRQPTSDDPRLYSKYSAAIVAVDVKTGQERWVSQLNEGDIYNQTMSGYDPKTERYKDCSIGDTPKIYDAAVDGRKRRVLGVGCKNGGFYSLDAADGRVVNHTPLHTGKPEYPLKPARDPRMLAVPSPIGGVQTGCATDGNHVFTNGIDWLSLNGKSPGKPEGGRVVSISADVASENWRHERPKVRSFGIFSSGDPVASGIALGGDIACFTTTVSEELVVLDRRNGDVLSSLEIGTVWSGPSISRGRIYVGTGSILFLDRKVTGTVFSFGLPGQDEVASMGAGDEFTP